MAVRVGTVTRLGPHPTAHHTGHPSWLPLLVQGPYRPPLLASIPQLLTHGHPLDLSGCLSTSVFSYHEPLRIGCEAGPGSQEKPAKIH